MALRPWQMVDTRRRRTKIKERPVSNRRWFNHGIGDALMLRSILPAIKAPFTLAIPEGRRYSELFQGFDNVSVEFADAPGKQYQPIEMNAEDSCLPVECGRPIKPRIALEHDFKVFDYTYRIRPLELDLSGANSVGAVATLERLKAIPGRYAVIHAHGASSPLRKDCPVEMAEWICDAVYSLGLIPVLVNYGNDRVYPFAANGRVVQTIGWPMDATSLWWLLHEAEAVIAIDSGVLHMAITIPDLPSLFVRNKIDFMRFFYDCGLEQVRDVLQVTDTKTETEKKVSQLCLSVQ